jgi:hypothetical protein
MDHLGRMNGPESFEPLEVPDIKGQQLRDAVNVHARGQAGVMDLHAFDPVGDEKPPPQITRAMRSVSAVLSPNPF